jgi:hypothetical protein
MNTLVILVARELWLERTSRVFDKMAVLPAGLVRRIKAEFPRQNFKFGRMPSCARKRRSERHQVADK